MKQKLDKGQAELSYYRLYLLNFLRENHPDKADDGIFISEREDHAAEIYEQAMRYGYTPDTAEELAIETLLQGLHFSRYATLLDIFDNEFKNEVPEANKKSIALHLLPIFEPIFSRYKLSDDFAQSSPEYVKLYTELTGETVLYLEAYGV